VKKIHLTFLAFASISSVMAACVNSAPSGPAPADAGDEGDAAQPADSGTKDSAPTEDSGSDVDAAPAWSPSQLAGLSLWLDAQKGVTGTTNVTAWADQSGQGNNFSQATAANQPALAAAAINGLNALQFTGASDSFLEIEPLSASLTIATGDFAVVEVVAWDNVPADTQQIGYACLFVPSPTTGFFANNPGVPNASAYAQLGGAISSTATTLNDAHYHYVAMRRTGTTLESRADGVGATTTISASANFTTGSIGAFIGGRIPSEGANQALDGHLAEVVVVNGTLSDADLGTLESYFKTKFAL
jgi:hypothetical protein